MGLGYESTVLQRPPSATVTSNAFRGWVGLWGFHAQMRMVSVPMA